MTRFRLSAIALTLLTSANAWADLRTFDVEPQYQQEIYVALANILDPKGQGTNGRVTLLPSGQILVNAEPATLEEVERVLQAVRTRSATAAPRVALRYWGVLGTQSKEAAVSSVGSPPPPVLNDVLSELKRVHGELTFRLIGTAAVATNSGQYGEVKGSTVEVEQTAHVQGDTLNAEISMKLRGTLPFPSNSQFFVTQGGNSFDFGELSLRTTLRRGEFVVLGESHLQGAAAGRVPVDGPVFYIVHWEE